MLKKIAKLPLRFLGWVQRGRVGGDRSLPQSKPVKMLQSAEVLPSLSNRPVQQPQPQVKPDIRPETGDMKMESLSSNPASPSQSSGCPFSGAARKATAGTGTSNQQ